MIKNSILILIGFILCLAIFNNKIFPRKVSDKTKNIPFEKIVNDVTDPRKKYDGLNLTKAMDLNKDGKDDFWIYGDTSSIFFRTAIDINKDGKIDNWDYIKNKKVWFSNRDTNYDGQIDHLILQIDNSDNTKHKMMSFFLKDKKNNLFEIELETDWNEGHILVDSPKK